MNADDELKLVDDDKGKRASGRVTFDERGHSVWEWQTQTGVFKRDIASHELERLEATELALVEEPKPRKFEGLWVHDSHRPARAIR